MKHLDQIPNNEISRLNIPTGFPLVYELDERLKPWNRYYLGDAKEIEQAMESVARQIRANPA